MKFPKRRDDRRGPRSSERPNDRRPPRNDSRASSETIDYKAQKKASSAVLDDWIWGEHSVESCADVNPENLLEIFVENSATPKLAKVLGKISGLNVSHVEKLPRFLTEKRTQGIAAKIKKFPVFYETDFFDKYADTEKKSQVLILDRIQDPQNFGAILRTAAALGARSIFISRRDQCPVNGTVALVSAGNVFRVNIFIANNLGKTCEKLKEHGYWVAALESGGSTLDKSLAARKPEKIAWILGAEEDGINNGLIKAADEKVGIPMLDGVESLNVSNSAAIALYAGYAAIKS